MKRQYWDPLVVLGGVPPHPVFVLLAVVAVFTTFSVVWELANQTSDDWVAWFISSPLDVFSSAQKWFVGDKFTQDILTSTYRALFGLCLGAPGHFAGILFAQCRYTRGLFKVLIVILLGFPRVSVLYLSLVFLGFGEVTIILLGSWITSIYLSFGGYNMALRYMKLGYMSEQVAGIDPSAKHLFLYILVPESLPRFFYGLHFITTFVWTMVILSEKGMTYGIGVRVFEAYDKPNPDPAMLIAGSLTLAVCGLATIWVIGQIEKRIVR